MKSSAPIDAAAVVLPTLHVRPSAQAVALAAASLVAALPESRRQEARLLDLFPQQGDEEMISQILAGDPQIVAFPLYLWNRRRVLELARKIKKRRPAIFLLAGGPEASAAPESVLRQGALDGVIRGEGEITFRELTAALARGERPDALAGFTLRRASGISAGPDRPPVADLDSLPSPWLSGVLSPGPGVLWETSRGCPFGCDFCYDARGARGVRHLSQARLADELDLFARSGVRQIWVLDSTFNYPPARGKKMLRLLAEKAPQIHFHLEAKADFLDREMVRLLSELSCSVQVGLQSIRPEVLSNIHRAIDPDAFGERMRLLGAEGITFGLDLIYGLPGDDYRGFCRSLDAALGFSPNHVDTFPLAVLPGTPLDRHRGKHGIEAQDHPPYEIIRSDTCGEADIERCRLLAAAADLFYNHGRAVGFFNTLVRATGRKPVSFLEGFASWALEQPGIDRQRLLAPEAWESGQLLALQEDYASRQLSVAGRTELVPAALDLIRYHFHYAEALLGDDLRPAPASTWNASDLWRTPWRAGEALRLVSFRYEIVDLMEMGEADLEQFASMFRPVGSVAAFFRQAGEVFCESLTEDFSRLLRGSDGTLTPEEIFAGSLARRDAEEIIEFALAEGFLMPPEKG